MDDDCKREGFPTLSPHFRPMLRKVERDLFPVRRGSNSVITTTKVSA
jgi:hypothetical protein